MDEPTSALDPISTGKIEELCKELKNEITVIMVTHNMQQAFRIADYTAYFLLGEMVEMGDTLDQSRACAQTNMPVRASTFTHSSFIFSPWPGAKCVGSHFFGLFCFFETGDCNHMCFVLYCIGKGLCFGT